MRSGQTPMLIMPDDTPAHPYAVCMEVSARAPKDLIPQAVRHVHHFLRAHQPVTSPR